MANIAQRNLSGGELAPALHARTDLAKYQSGLRTLRNFLICRSGGVENAPGTAYVAAARYAARTAALRPFVVSDDLAYVMEWGHHTLRFHRNGAPVLDGLTPYELATPYDDDEVHALQFAQTHDAVRIAHPAHPPYVLTRVSALEWTLAAVDIGPATPAPGSVSLSGGAAPSVFYAVTAVDADTGEESLPGLESGANTPSSGTPTTVTYTAVPGVREYNIYRGTVAGSYGYVGTAGGTPEPASTTTFVDADATATTTTEDAWVASADEVEIDVIATIGDKAYDEIYHLLGTITLTATGGVPEFTHGRVSAYYSRDAEPPVLYYEPVSLGGPHEGSGSSGAMAFDFPIRVPDNGYTDLTLTLVPEVYGEGDGGTTYTADLVGTSLTCVLAVSTTYVDVGEATNTAIAPPTQRDIFALAGDYPAAVGAYQQRTLYGGSTAEPSTVWASRTGSLDNFATSIPLRDDDAVSFTLTGRQVSQVRHLRDFGRLVIFTGDAVFVADGDESGALTPTAINLRRIWPHGANTLPPIEVGDSALYVQARGAKVRDLKPQAVSDSGYTGSDLTTFASHLFDGHTITDWAYQEEPHSRVWVVRDDGILLCLTYVPEQAVWGWSRRDVGDDAVESICAVPEGREDAVYVLVRRTVNGATVRYVERMASRYLDAVEDAHFVDAAVAYDGTNAGATTVTLSGGSTWDYPETLTATASASTFAAGDVGGEVRLTHAAGTLRATITAYTSTTVVTVQPQSLVPASLRTTATTAWALARRTLTGLAHLEGAAVSVLADGVVLASVHNATYPSLTVASGAVTLSHPVVRALVGLPITADLETLDIDTASGASRKTAPALVQRVLLAVESSRGVFAGRVAPERHKDYDADDPDPLAGLFELPARQFEDYGAAPRLRTETVSVDVERSYDTNGRVFVRQVDPLPLTVLAVTPVFTEG